MRISDWSSDVCSSDLRTWSTHDDSFWCCVGSGMESHSKHGDSIYWHDASTLYVNLFIASTLDWDGWKLDLATRFPFEDRKSVVAGKGVSVRVDIGGRRTINKKHRHDI